MSSASVAYGHRVAVPAIVQWRARHFSQRLLPLSCVFVHCASVASSLGPLDVGPFASAASWERKGGSNTMEKQKQQHTCWPAVVTANRATTKAHKCKRAVQGEQICVGDVRHGKAARCKGRENNLRIFDLLDAGVGEDKGCTHIHKTHNTHTHTHTHAQQKNTHTHTHTHQHHG